MAAPERFAELTRPPDPASYRLQELRERRPFLAAVVEGLGPAASERERLAQLARFTARLEHRFPSPEHSNAGGYYTAPTDFIWGGTEEFVIAKGSDWCGEVARTFCALAQVAGIGARLVYTCSHEDGHVIAEAYADGVWTLVDPLAPKVYGRGAVDMARATPAERAALTAGREGPYVDPAFFTFIAVSDYRLIDAARYDYGLSYCNEYYARLLAPVWNGGRPPSKAHDVEGGRG